MSHDSFVHLRGVYSRALSQTPAAARHLPRALEHSSSCGAFFENPWRDPGLAVGYSSIYWVPPETSPRSRLNPASQRDHSGAWGGGGARFCGLRNPPRHSLQQARVGLEQLSRKHYVARTPQTAASSAGTTFCWSGRSARASTSVGVLRASARLTEFRVGLSH